MTTTDDLIRQTLAAFEAETRSDHDRIREAQGRIDKRDRIAAGMRALLTGCVLFPTSPDGMPLGWHPKHWEHVQRKGTRDNGGQLQPRERRRRGEAEERLYPGNDHTTRARRIGVGVMGACGGVWLTIPECWTLESARKAAA